MDKDFDIKKKVGKNLKTINISVDKMFPYATTPFKQLSIFIHCRVQLKIETNNRKILCNRVERCHCTNTKMIDGYLMMVHQSLKIDE